MKNLHLWGFLLNHQAHSTYFWESWGNMFAVVLLAKWSQVILHIHLKLPLKSSNLEVKSNSRFLSLNPKPSWYGNMNLQNFVRSMRVWLSSFIFSTKVISREYLYGVTKFNLTLTQSSQVRISTSRLSAKRILCFEFSRKRLLLKLRVSSLKWEAMRDRWLSKLSGTRCLTVKGSSLLWKPDSKKRNSIIISWKPIISGGLKVLKCKLLLLTWRNFCKRHFKNKSCSMLSLWSVILEMGSLSNRPS